jgi:hypothetical protein
LPSEQACMYPSSEFLDLCFSRSFSRQQPNRCRPQRHQVPWSRFLR